MTVLYPTPFYNEVCYKGSLRDCTVQASSLELFRPVHSITFELAHEIIVLIKFAYLYLYAIKGLAS